MSGTRFKKEVVDNQRSEVIHKATEYVLERLPNIDERQVAQIAEHTELTLDPREMAAS